MTGQVEAVSSAFDAAALREPVPEVRRVLVRRSAGRGDPVRTACLGREALAAGPHARLGVRDRHTSDMRFVDWLFRDRVTGGFTVGQFPSWSLGTWLASVAVRVVLHPRGTAGAVVEAVGTAALVVWAVDEMVRGVNPWRRILGTIVLAATAAGATRRLAT